MGPMTISLGDTMTSTCLAHQGPCMISASPVSKIWDPICFALADARRCNI